jgi:hypothetical protein
VHSQESVRIKQNVRIPEKENRYVDVGKATSHQSQHYFFGFFSVTQPFVLAEVCDGSKGLEGDAVLAFL